jgi:hypothetical protein
LSHNADMAEGHYITQETIQKTEWTEWDLKPSTRNRVIRTTWTARPIISADKSHH